MTQSSRFFTPRGVGSFDQFEAALDSALGLNPISTLQRLYLYIDEDPALDQLHQQPEPTRKLIRALAGYGLASLALKRDQDGRWPAPGPGPAPGSRESEAAP